MADDEIILYRSVASRSFMALWMLEELGVPYRMETRDILSGEQKSPEFLKINPMGKVPVLVIGETVVTEAAAICLFLADRFGYGALVPRIEEAGRGACMRWIVFAVATAEPALVLRGETLTKPSRRLGWGSYEDVARTLAGAIQGREFLLGDRFSVADVVLGGLVTWGIVNGQLDDVPPFSGYNKRLTARPAYQAASAITWPAALFPPPPEKV